MLPKESIVGGLVAGKTKDGVEQIKNIKEPLTGKMLTKRFIAGGIRGLNLESIAENSSSVKAMFGELKEQLGGSTLNDEEDLTIK